MAAGRTVSGCNHDVSVYRHNFDFLSVSSVCFHAVQSVTQLTLQRKSTESSCVYCAVLGFSLRRSKSEQVLLSTVYICFTL